MTLVGAVEAFLLSCMRARIEVGWTPCSLLRGERSSIARIDAAASATAAALDSIAGMLRRTSLMGCALPGRNRLEKARSLRFLETDHCPSTAGIEHVRDSHDGTEKGPRTLGR